MIPLSELDSNIAEFERTYYFGGTLILFVVTGFSGLFCAHGQHSREAPFRRTEEVMKAILITRLMCRQRRDRIAHEFIQRDDKEPEQTQEELKQLNQTLNCACSARPMNCAAHRRT